MRDDYTHIAFVLDRSGSMDVIASDTIGGFNSFIESQKKVPGKATFTLLQFDDEFEPVYKNVDLQTVRPLDFHPRGLTALYDAVGKTIVETGEFLSTLPESERPSKVIFVILTDGFENASKEYTAGQISQMITHQREVYSWEFVFLAANQDAITTAKGLSIPVTSAMSFAVNTMGVASSYDSIAKNLSNYRTGAAASAAFTPEDYDNQTDAFNSNVTNVTHGTN